MYEIYYSLVLNKFSIKSLIKSITQVLLKNRLKLAISFQVNFFIETMVRYPNNLEPFLDLIDTIIYFNLKIKSLNLLKICLYPALSLEGLYASKYIF